MTNLPELDGPVAKKVPGETDRPIVSTSLRIIGLLVFLIPWGFLLSHLEGLRKNEEESLTTRYRQLMLTELEDFYRDLDPPSHIQEILDVCDRADGLLSRTEGNIRHPSPDQDPKIISKAFLSKRRRQLREIYGLRPIFMTTAGCDLHDVRWWANNELLRKTSPKNLAELADVILFGSAEPGRRWVPNPSRRFNRWDDDERDRFKDLSRLAFGYFWNFHNIIEGSSQCSFAESADQQTLITSCRFLYSSDKDSRSTFGGYVMVFKEGNLPWKKILDRALRNPRQHNLFQRVLTSTPAGASRSASPGILSGPLPVAYSNLFSRSNGKEQNLSVILSRPPFDNPFQTARTVVFWLGMSLLGIWFSVQFAARSSAFPWIGLRWKLIAIISLTVLLPFIGLALMALKWLNGHSEDLPRRAGIRMETRTSFIANRIQEWGRQRQLKNSRARRRLPYLFTVGPKDLRDALHESLKSISQGDFIFFLPDNGIHSIVGGGRNAAQTDFQVALGKRLLKNLGAYQGAGQKPQELVTGEFMDFFWKLNRAPEVLCREGLETGYVFSVLENQHMNFFLIPSAPGSKEIGGLAVIRLHYFKGFEERLDEFLSDSFPLFYDSSSFANSRFGVFAISSAGTRGHSWPLDAHRDPFLHELADHNSRVRGSTFIQRQTSDEHVLQVSSKADPYGFLVTGTSVIPGKGFLEGTAPLVLGFLILYAFLLVTFMADLLSVLFLRPITLFVDATASIGGGRFDTRVPQNSGDEFEEMGRAFNRMATALQQREALRSFIPQRLIHQIISTSGKTPVRHGENIQVIILASDIRGFTSLSERLPPELLVTALNDYFTCMQDAITSEGGMILKLVGDAILAVFYPDSQGILSVEKAIRAARRMRSSLGAWNAARIRAGEFPFENGIGLAMGPVLSGELGGSQGRRDFTVVGAVVAEATSLESLSAKAPHSRIIIDHAIRQALSANDIAGELHSEAEGQPMAWEVVE